MNRHNHGAFADFLELRGSDVEGLGADTNFRGQFLDELQVLHLGLVGAGKHGLRAFTAIVAQSEAIHVGDGGLTPELGHIYHVLDETRGTLEADELPVLYFLIFHVKFSGTFLLATPHSPIVFDIVFGLGLGIALQGAGVERLDLGFNLLLVFENARDQPERGLDFLLVVGAVMGFLQFVFILPLLGKNLLHDNIGG